jgi:hypothetical protein
MNVIHLVRKSNRPGIIGEHMLVITQFNPHTGIPRFFHVLKGNTNSLFTHPNRILASLQAGQNPVHNGLAQMWRRLTPQQFINRIPNISRNFKPLPVLSVRNRPSKTSNRRRPKTPNSNVNNR